MTANPFALYSQKILALASAIPHVEPIKDADGRASRRSPLCGSEIEVALCVEDGVVAAFSQNTRACALGQCSAAIFGKQILGRSKGEVMRLKDELAEFLAGGDVPRAPYSEYEVLRPAQGYPRRHASIMLIVDATIAAIADAGA